MKRRAFLQRTGLAVASLVSGDWAFSPLIDRYHRALAAPTNRKLALLVGINQYNRSSALAGCLTDVELQRELLIHRFGFHPGDILTLTEQQATRQNLEAAFLTHLTQQARAGDTVVCHFSGYGSTVATSLQDSQPSLVMVNEWSQEGEAPIVSDLLADTWVLLLRSLATDRVTTVLDTSYTEAGGSLLQGSLRGRSRSNPSGSQPSPDALDFQGQLMERLQLSREQLGTIRRSQQYPGVVLSAAALDQVATEVHWSGFSAGAFTYALTRYLWQATPPTTLRSILGQTTVAIAQQATLRQQPQLSGQKSQDQPLRPYHLESASREAEGIVVAVEEGGKAGRLWLGGLSPMALEQYPPNALLAAVSAPGPSALVQITARDGLMARVRLLADKGEAAPEEPALQVGQLFQEATRIVPRNLGLTIALDPSLERIERVDAISALSSLNRISAVPSGDQPADYLFGKATISPTQVAALPSMPLPALGLAGTASNPRGYGLFSLGRELLLDTPGSGSEAVKVAVRRLAPRLQTLLAAKLLSLTTNASASRLGIQASLERVAAPNQILGWQTTPRSPWSAPSGSPAPEIPLGLPTLASGDQLLCQLHNYSPEAVYFLLFHLDSNGNLMVLRPAANGELGTAGTIAGQLEAGATLNLPPAAATTPWVVRGLPGLAEIYLICSKAPFAQTQATLEAVLHGVGDSPLVFLPNPPEVAQAVLQDLHQASSGLATVPGSTADAFVLAMNAWAAFRFSYQIAAA